MQSSPIINRQFLPLPLLLPHRYFLLAGNNWIRRYSRSPDHGNANHPTRGAEAFAISPSGRIIANAPWLALSFFLFFFFFRLPILFRSTSTPSHLSLVPLFRHLSPPRFFPRRERNCARQRYVLTRPGPLFLA